MIEINLIPDVKQEFIRAQQIRNAAIGISVIVGLAAVTVVVALGIFLGGQTLTENTVRANIKKDYHTLSSVADIDNILTIQNQLASISVIHDKKSIDSRIFDVLTAISPAAPNDIKISSLRLDPKMKTLMIEGSASNGYSATETFRKLILNTTVESGAGDKLVSIPLTDKVLMGETSYGEGANGGKVLRFSLSFVYPEGLFDNTRKDFRFVTPSDVTDVTDSRTRVPDSLFGEKAKDVTGGGN
ncbi:MAG: hypothetical protein WAQ25_01010 [Candidatus Saccharimonas sp.]